ncbi:MAG TPA: class I SAM-dependent methyltransferase [Thermoanaerobaculia bacterium]
MTAELVESMQEVHRWRGTPEQRAVRDQVRKLGQFAFFDRQLGHPDWRGKKVLDFGGCDGNLLRNPDCTIAHEDYYCLDVVKEAIEEGRKAFPSAHWFHYDRYNCAFNPDGVRDAPVPDLGVAFDVILAYSVFTHTTREEMHDLVAQLRAKLAPGGAFAFTFEDPHYRPYPDVFDGNNVEWRMGASVPRSSSGSSVPRPEQNAPRGTPRNPRNPEELEHADWCSLVNGTHLHLNGNGEWRDESSLCMTYDVYYTPAFIQREFPDATVLPPVNGEMQHCCVLRSAR